MQSQYTVRQFVSADTRVGLGKHHCLLVVDGMMRWWDYTVVGTGDGEGMETNPAETEWLGTGSKSRMMRSGTGLAVSVSLSSFEWNVVLWWKMTENMTIQCVSGSEEW